MRTTIKLICVLATLLLGNIQTYAQEKEPLKLISTSIEMTPFSTGYVNAKGDTVIPIGKYVYCYTEVFDKIAVVLPKDRKEFIAIDRNEKELFVVLSTDNGPDYIKDGMFRIKINNKTGFANMQGHIIKNLFTILHFRLRMVMLK